ncbi:hypothetical protein C9J03_02405 [Photobacterium gaetbulicola]|uniref:Nitroreductase domain-containing protein n=1 Tax=Photobacterium gaetbulicola Gung47 TaxID=658445 RepID=A0A0C5WCS1_9GAMM|nr:nitroreductase family protein [Photobacterium gaetbulicola]AJR09501.1 hypothetical protein H744_2c2848 [Photobacterium gaetbulicola Gung47]PSU14295.1 hypothetical protein C9J03_02405 [Photobacterium gaetbulicola]
MKKFAKYLLEKSLLELNFISDYISFKKYYSKSSVKNKDKKQLEAWILQDKHRIEKALSLPEPKTGFGQDVVPRLCENLKLWSSNYTKEDVYYFGIGALSAYVEFHRVKAIALSEKIQFSLREIDEQDFQNEKISAAGVLPYPQINTDFSDFFDDFSKTRHSCRNFSNQLITHDDILEVINQSIRAPSVCNRQHWKVHIFSGDKKEKVLSFQNGNRGFNENIPYVALITSDLKAFYSANERNQAFTDGGIFAMNFIYSLHSKGISSCALNWCNSFVVEHKFKKESFIPLNEKVIVAIAFGYPKDDALYAKSPRKDHKEFLTVHD